MRAMSCLAVLALVVTMATGCPGPKEDPPQISSIDPATGPMKGGTPVVIGGTGFHEGAAVSFGDVPADSIVVASVTEIHAVTPAHPSGWSGVIVRNPSGQDATLANAFFFDPPVLLVSPTSGAAAGGYMASIATLGGYTFVQPVQVTFGGTQATVRSSPTPTETSFLVDVPAGATGTVEVVVVNADTTVFPATATFTYQ